MSFPFVIKAPPTTDSDNLRLILSEARQYARPPISQFRVAAMAIGQSGNAYIGVNLEFDQQPLSQTIHAEQFAVALARQHGELGIQQMIVTAMPCGHCRQFLLELGVPNLPITVLEDTCSTHTSLDALLPHPFTLSSHRHGLLAPSVFSLRVPPSAEKSDAVLQALNAASRSYVPYSKSWSGVSITLNDGRLFSGGSIESAAYNPTFPALQATLTSLVSQHVAYDSIQDIVLVEWEHSKTSARFSANALAKTLAPQATFTFMQAAAHEL